MDAFEQLIIQLHARPGGEELTCDNGTPVKAGRTWKAQKETTVDNAVAVQVHREKLFSGDAAPTDIPPPAKITVPVDNPNCGRFYIMCSAPKERDATGNWVSTCGHYETIRDSKGDPIEDPSTGKPARKWVPCGYFSWLHNVPGGRMKGIWQREWVSGPYVSLFEPASYGPDKPKIPLALVEEVRKFREKLEAQQAALTAATNG